MGFFGGKSSSNSGTKKVPNSRKKKEAQQTTIKKKENINTKKSSSTTKSSSNNNTSIQTSVPTATSSSISPSAPTVNAHERINAKNTSMPQTIDLEMGAAETGPSKSEEAALFTFTFHVESLRLFAHIGLFCVFLQGALITQYSGLNSIPDEEATEIFRIFSFNHTCNWIDHNPARMIAAILIPLYTVPTLGYIMLTHLRLARSVKKGEVPCWLLQTSRILSPFNFLAVALLHLVSSVPCVRLGTITLLHCPLYPLLIISSGLDFHGYDECAVPDLQKRITLGLEAIDGLGLSGHLCRIDIDFYHGCHYDSCWNTDARYKEQCIGRAAFRAMSSIYGIMILIFPIALSARERMNGDTITLNA